VDAVDAVDKITLQLISRCREGDEWACRQLYKSGAPRVAGYFRRSGFDPSAVDDLTQETFARVFKSLGRFDPAKGAFFGWLGAIARNVARKRWKRAPAPENFDPELAEEMFADPAAQSPEHREEIMAVGDCVDRLEDQGGALVRMRYVRGMTTRGIAAETGIPESTVRSRLAEALAGIEECLRGKGILE